LPFFKRLELLDGVWTTVHFPINLGDSRDIPYHKGTTREGNITATLHPSVHRRWAMEQGLPTETVRADPRRFPRDNQEGWKAALTGEIPPQKETATWLTGWIAGGISGRKLLAAVVLLVAVVAKPVIALTTGGVGYIRL
jgi:hypothetical protein